MLLRGDHGALRARDHLQILVFLRKFSMDLFKCARHAEHSAQRFLGNEKNVNQGQKGSDGFSRLFLAPKGCAVVHVKGDQSPRLVKMMHHFHRALANALVKRKRDAAGMKNVRALVNILG